ncbi:MAG: aminodeoxychorismate synthase, component I [Gammaproteobacteria bacterium]|nr:MAG: aminodeoxychorismate synthase, component I [Gammaproteobacteria bacterium]
MPQKTLNQFINVYHLHRQFPETFPFLLESVAENTKIGRYDILLYRPQEKITLDSLSDADFLSRFDNLWRRYQGDEDKTIPTDIPFRGGWFVFFGYELAGQIEPTLSLTEPPYPTAYAAKCGAAIVVDKLTQQTHFVADLSESDAMAEMSAYVEQLTPDKGECHLSVVIREDDEQPFIDGVEKSRQYIIDGDVFQVNLSRAWQFDLPGTDCNTDNDHYRHIATLYHKLRQENPAPFAASCHLSFDNNGDTDSVSILSSSPERLISIRNGRIETRPIAGTRPRHSNKDKDEAFSSELIGHFKERAEHIMLIDLERNDLGRICTAGTVKVDELMTVESYAHVHHIVSNVIGQIRGDISPADAIRAVFPGGTITGCPKVRCMEIIHELEQTCRGVYTGSLGYVNHNGDMDSNILIRTFACHGGKVEFRAGAGIVYDSIAQHELKETRNKAKGLLKALGNKNVTI